jgi:hypothetical protein
MILRAGGGLVGPNAPLSKACNVGFSPCPDPAFPTRPSATSTRSPQIIHLAVMLYVKYPLSRRNVEYLLARRVIDVSHDTVRHWCNRFRMELLVPTDRVSSPMVCFCLP